MRFLSLVRIVIALTIVGAGVFLTDVGIEKEPAKLFWKPLVELPIPGASADNLFWFIHVTDIHISHSLPENRLERFNHLVEHTIEQIAPKFVLVTGDLCHGKDKDQRNNNQFVSEWKMYREVLEKNNRFDSNFWIDLRGNHDCFNTGLKGLANHEANPFYKYSVTGFYYQNAVRTFTHHLEDDFSSYSVISVDGCPSVGAKSPLNFFGKLSRSELDELERRIYDHRQHNHTIVIGHYPLSTIVSEYSTSGKTLEEILVDGNVTAYLCGHLHKAFGENLKARHSLSLLEYELGDFKSNNMYRIMAVDHDMISFVDQEQDEWPVVLITNPKNAEFLSENEPFERIELSTHIRILAFSTAKIKHILVEIDSEIISDSPVNSNQQSPLYTIPWNPRKYISGLHKIQVTVTDSTNRVKTQQQSFSVDGTIKEFDSYAQFILTGPIQQILIWGFVGIDVAVFVFLILISWTNNNNEEATTLGGWIQSLFKARCYHLRSSTFLYSILLLSWGCMMFLPWFMGKISDPDHYGCVFLWGVVHFYEKGPKQLVVEYIHTLDTHLFASFQLFNYLSSLCFFWLFSGMNSEEYLRPLSRKRKACLVLFVYLFSIYQLFNSWSVMARIAKIYEWNSLILSPMVAWYNWFVIVYILYFLISMIYHALKQPESPTEAKQLTSIKKEK